jgi:hypothetical protein
MTVTARGARFMEGAMMDATIILLVVAFVVSLVGFTYNTGYMRCWWNNRDLCREKHDDQHWIHIKASVDRIADTWNTTDDGTQVVRDKVAPLVILGRRTR